jgi:CBS domain containing-hemolysin-like protein
MITLLIAVGLSVGISFLCSLLESVLYSTRVLTLEAAAGRGSPQAVQMRNLKAKVEKPLAAILILNTLSNTGGAALAGWAAGEVWGDPAALIAFSAGFTLVVLLGGEIFPKTLGAVHWRRLWPRAVWPLTAMIKALRPLIWLSQAFTSLVIRGPGSAPRVSDEEILAAARLGARAGQISQMEHDLIRNIIGLEEVKAEGVMTPRTVVVAADGALTIAQAKEQAKAWGFTRVPVFRGGPEDVAGYVLKSEVLAAPPAKGNEPLASLAKPLRFVPASANALDLLDSFLRRREHMVMVVDEYGGIMGLLTLEDVLESLVGSEIVDEKDQVDDLQDLARRRGRVVLAKSEGEEK